MRGTFRHLSPVQALPVRLRKALLCVGIGCLVLLLRLWYLQILEGDRYFTLSTNNRIRLRVVEAPRGFILDRHGEVLVENRPTFDLYATPEDVKNPQEVAATLAGILKVAPGDIEARLAEGRTRPYQPLLIRKDLDEAMMVSVEERRLDLPGVNLRIRPIRAYPSTGTAANLLGYVSEVNQAQLQREEFRDFRPGESLGQSGVERRFDAFIRGVDGGEQIEVDARGRALRLVSRIDPRSGANVFLTIDRKVQEAAEAAFAGKKGTVVAMNPTTGEIVAMVSRPSFDPNLFAQRLSGDEWQRIATDASHPLQNRAFQAQYPPGSIFKLIVAIAGLESGILTPETKFNCAGTVLPRERQVRRLEEGRTRHTRSARRHRQLLQCVFLSGGPARRHRRDRPRLPRLRPGRGSRPRAGRRGQGKPPQPPTATARASRPGPRATR